MKITISYPSRIAGIIYLLLAGLFCSKASANVISYVDTSLDGSQKYVLRVDGKPFYMTNIQVRMDVMRYSDRWTSETREALVARLAADGFNTLSIPLHWYEVEPEKDKFDWTILDEYLQLMNKYNLKMEMLWFGTNSGGHTQWLNPQWANTSKADPVHLRVPDYVLYAPQYGSPGWSRSQEEGSHETTSEFNIRRDMTNYTLDLGDTRLRDRETYVLSKVMEHIAVWDKANGSRHPIIGVQIGNEVRGQHVPFENTVINNYLSHVAGAVKNSGYVVWTRVNCVFMDVYARVFENERLRNTPEGTNLDMIGIDTYSHHFPTAEEFMASMRTNIPYAGKNYRMIMETNSERPYSAQMHLAALSGNNAFDYYDASGLYRRDGDGVSAKSPHIEDIRLVNKILTSALEDIALNAHGYGLFVHNWQGNKSDVTVSNTGISFTPSYPTSQGISIIRSRNEIVLMSTKGGTFTIPASLKITGASKGRFDNDNQWINESEVNYRQSREGQEISINIQPGTTIRLTCKDTGKTEAQTYQAEFADLCVGTENQSSIEGIGFAGIGYAKFPSTEGAYIQFNRIDGEEGGNKTIRIRYALGGKREARMVVFVNGTMNQIKLTPTGSFDNYRYVTFQTPLNSGTDNTIKLETRDNLTRINRAAYYETNVSVDEIQVTDASSDMYGYLLVHFTHDRKGYGERVYLNVSRGDDVHKWDYLNGGEPVLVSNMSTTGIRDPFIAYNPEKQTYYILTTDLRTYGGDECGWELYGSDYCTTVNVWESRDLITWSPLRSFDVKADKKGNPIEPLVDQVDGRKVHQSAMMWAPEATWVPSFYDLNDDGMANGSAKGGAFVIYWSTYATVDGMSRKMVLWGATPDFTQATYEFGGVFMEEMKSMPGNGVIDANLIQKQFPDGKLRTYRIGTANSGDKQRGTYMESTDVQAWWREKKEWKELQTLIGAEIMPETPLGVEGPAAFKANGEENWYLFVDAIGGNKKKGYTLLESDNIDKEKPWRAVEKKVELNPHTKHGGVIPLTKAQYDAIRAADALPAENMNLTVPGVIAPKGTKPDIIAGALPANVSVKSCNGYGTNILPVRWHEDDLTKVTKAKKGDKIKVSGTVVTIGSNFNHWKWLQKETGEWLPDDDPTYFFNNPKGANNNSWYQSGGWQATSETRPLYSSTEITVETTVTVK